MPTIKCTDKQAFLIELCLDTMCRASVGQLTHIIEAIEQIRGKLFEAECPDGEARSYCALGNYIEEMIKPILFPDLSPNASYGVGRKEIGKAQVLYEMSKVLQNYRAEKEKHHEYAVSWHKPLHYSKEPLIEVMSSEKKAKPVKNSQSTTFDNSSKIRL